MFVQILTNIVIQYKKNLIFIVALYWPIFFVFVYILGMTPCESFLFAKKWSLKLKKKLNWDSLYARLNSHCESWGYKKKKHKKVKAYKKSVQKELEFKRCLLILDLKPLRSYIKGNHSTGTEFQSLAVQGKKLLAQTSV